MKLTDFPFLSWPHTLTLLRVATALFFMVHALSRILLGTIGRFGGFMESAGFPHGVYWVWAITVSELVAGTLLICNRHVRLAASVLFTVAAGGIVLIHRHFGWFVGEHGTGGSEYSVALMVLLLVIAAADREAHRRTG
ncbi:MAG: DoxX family protein [Proteobacteria bacterium]|nr:DoxX family protein [Pseudomonadota bacterium]